MGGMIIPLNPFALAVEIIRTPFNPANLTRYDGLSQQNLRYRPLISLLLEAQQRPYSTIQKERFKTLPSELERYKPLIGLASIVAGKITPEEKKAILSPLTQLLLEDSSNLCINKILAEPMPAAKRLEITEYLIIRLGLYRDFYRLSQEDNKKGLRHLKRLWEDYPRLWEAVHHKPWQPKPQRPHHLTCYFKCLLQFHQQKLLRRGELQLFSEFSLAYAQQYPSEECPNGRVDGWSQRLLALREVATIYMIGVDLQLWPNKEIDTVFPGYSTQLKEAAFDYPAPDEKRYAEAEIEFLESFSVFEPGEDEIFIVPEIVPQVKLIMESVVQLNFDSDCVTFEALCLLHMHWDGLLQEWLYRPQVQKLMSKAVQIFKEDGLAFGLGCIPFTRRFFAKERLAADVATVFGCLLQYFELKLRQVLHEKGDLAEKIILAATMALPEMRKIDRAYAMRLSEIFPKHLPATNAFVMAMRGHRRVVFNPLPFIEVGQLLSPSYQALRERH